MKTPKRVFPVKLSLNQVAIQSGKQYMEKPSFKFIVTFFIVILTIAATSSMEGVEGRVSEDVFGLSDPKYDDIPSQAACFTAENCKIVCAPTCTSYQCVGGRCKCC